MWSRLVPALLFVFISLADPADTRGDDRTGNLGKLGQDKWSLPAPGPQPKPQMKVVVRDAGATDDTLSPSEPVVRRVRHGYMGQLRACYRATLRKDPGLRGKVVLSFAVNRKGRTEQVVARGTTSPDLEACVAARAARWRFSKAQLPRDVPTHATFELAVLVTLDQ